ncbi:DsbA family protein [Pontivivens insulae]|uniref:Thioredoxin domain-containing protein n=1 Tax=Pontivivens insulae TaxID=1639689 RepID=A0A2R8AFZ3_9RHOB|nr:DsbA family protein [Pontivivens insulae]RED10626.1 protein-disulfide isomerase [Pontivivens insulae]SPF31164.1 hypothetical protein POI8812_03515 [Pontivivens insulae]
MKNVLSLLALTVAIAALALTLFAPAPNAVGTRDDAAIKALSLEAIIENPDIIAEAIAILRERQAAEQEQFLAASLESDPNAPVLGNTGGDITVVEFFDYNCTYCKAAMPIVQELLESDDDVRLVYREWPILGEGSIFAARAALASRAQGRYEEMHWALMALPRADEASVMSVARELNLDIGKLLADMNDPAIDAHINLSHQLAERLEFSGTPSFVVGDTRIPGLVPLRQLELIIDDERNNDG